MSEEGYTVPASRRNNFNNSNLPMHVRKVNEQAQNAYLYAPLDHFDQDKHIEGWKSTSTPSKKIQTTKTKRNYTRLLLTFQKKGKRKITDSGTLAIDTHL
jgi:hypothetical protein